MFDVEWRSDGAAAAADRAARDADLARADGAGELVFAHRAGGTRLVHLFQSSPCRIAFPRPEPGDLPLGVVLTTTGGLTGGDRVRLSLAVQEDAAALVTTQAAEKIYRSLGEDARIAVQLRVANGGWLEWLPQETILFEGARLRRVTEAEVSGNGRLLAGEMLVFGRAAHGERFTSGLACDGWRVRRSGHLVWADALRLDRDIPRLLAGIAGFGGARALATVIYVGADAADRLDEARDLLDGAVSDGLRVGATCIGEVLIVRLLGREAYSVRRAFGAFWRGFRARVAGLPPRLPRLWDV